ncbi:MAG: hypothetical protein DMF56_04165 [Acidobacteria bacterium]|nr:MAG: hypothetical protein DMF56_04165 [Acidobacteriota bacterium]
MARSVLPFPVSRRKFLASTAAATAGLALAPLAAAAESPGCKRLREISEGWDTAVRPMLASRYHRLQHVFFHYIRNNWDRLTAAQQRALTDLKWAAPRASLFAPTWSKRPNPDDNTVVWATHNGSGIDFLYFHRWMIAMVNKLLSDAGKPTLAAWSDTDTIPAPKRGCPDESVPDFTPWFEDPSGPPIRVEWLQLRVKEMKSDSFYWDRMNWWGIEFRDFGALRNMTLGELGSRLEFSVHNQMHIRWSAFPSNGSLTIRDEPDFRAKWDDPGYDTLFDEYSSHVTPIFFRLHKWIDNRIEDWAEAQRERLTRYDTGLGFDWFKGSSQWIEVDQPWSSPYGMHHPTPEEQKLRIATMEKIGPILFPPKALGKRTPEEQEQDERRILSIRDLA